MRKFITWGLWIICIGFVFCAGFYIGTLDTDANKIKVSSQCTGIGVEKTFSANYERVGNEVIKDEKTNSETYTTRCLCFASNADHKDVWVDTIEISGDSEESVRNTCNSDCQNICETRLENFTFLE